jgi:Ring finger domain
MVLDASIPPSSYNQTEAFPFTESYNTTIITTRMGNDNSDLITNIWGSGLAVIAFILFCWLKKRQPVSEEHLWHRRLFLLRPDDDEVEDPADRQVRIKKALAVQTVMGCDAEGTLQLGNGSTLAQPQDVEEEDPECQTAALPGAPSSASQHEQQQHNTYESSICCVCLEAYEVGEVVAWNRQRRCRHVFHQDCLAGWLVKHNDCPSCRLPILEKKVKRSMTEDTTMSNGVLPVEPPGGEQEHEQDDAASVTSVSSGAVFAIVHGLIARVRSGLNKTTTTTTTQPLSSSSSSSSPVKIAESTSTSSPAIFRRRVVSFGGGGLDAPNPWTSVVQASSTSTSNESSDEECGGGASDSASASGNMTELPLQLAASVYTSFDRPSSSSSVEDRAETGTLQIVQTTQPWMTDTLLSDGETSEEEDDADDTEEDDIVRDERSDEECGGGGMTTSPPLQLAASVHCRTSFDQPSSASVADRAETTTLQIVQTTQPWMAHTLLSDGETTGDEDEEEDEDADDDVTVEDNIIRGETSDEECGGGGAGSGMASPLQRAASVHCSTSFGLPSSSAGSVEDRAEAGTLQIAQTTQLWTADTLLSDGETTEEGDEDENDDTEEDDIVRDDRARFIETE